jgi:TRAP-type C4-dicarboxylate transport system permease small subunit
MNGIKIYLSWADRVYAKTIKAILILLMISIPLTCGLAVVFRYFIKKPLHGSDEILMLLGVWLYYL